jgi:hypothetical protein
MKLGKHFSGKAPILAAAMIGSAAWATGCGSVATTPAGSGGSTAAGGAATSQAAPTTGKDITNFDPCAVVSDSDYVQALTAESSDPSAIGTISPSHKAVTGTDTGLPGAKACQLSYTTTDSAGRVNQGGDPVIVTFDAYGNLKELQGNDPVATSDYASAGAEAWEGPGDAGVPHITKDGYLFRMSGNSDTRLLKAIALGIAGRL